MEYLDLRIHSPEEYEGKFVAWNDGEYVVGEYLGSGVERIVHKLVNRKSGLCLHVLKVWRPCELGYVPSEMRAMSNDLSEHVIIPVSIEIRLPGGSAEMQMFTGTDEPDKSVDDLLQQGEQLLYACKYSEAAGVYEQILKLNVNQTRALIGLADVRRQLGDVKGAWELAVKAREIEPNYPLFHAACIVYLAAQGLHRLALLDFIDAQRMFPNVHDLDHLAVSLYIACGDPDQAVRCAETCISGPRMDESLTVTKSEKQQLMDLAHKAQDARGKASPLIIQAKQALDNDQAPQKVAALLAEAHAADTEDPFLACNLGFALAKLGKQADAINLFVPAAYCVTEELLHVCLANAAFCAIETNDPRGAMALLTLTFERIMSASGGREPSDLLAELPGRGKWMTPDVLKEERITSASSLVNRYVENAQSSAPESVKHLAALYRKAERLDHAR